MAPNISCVNESIKTLEFLEKTHRTPVANANDYLKKIISVDDLILALSKEVSSSTKVLSQH
jgi:hypothetical protein